MIILLLLACEPHKIRDLDEIKGEWFGDYQIGQGEEDWSDLEIEFVVYAAENESNFTIFAPESDPSQYTITYNCDIYLAERGFLRMPNCTETTTVYDDRGKIEDQTRTAYDEIRFSRVERSGERLFLGGYILSR